MTNEPRGLAERIARLEDIEAIRHLKSTYHTYINDTRFDDVPALFTQTATVKLGYLMPEGRAWVGREQITAAFASMKDSTAQSQVKQFLHSHIVELGDVDSATGTGLLEARYGVKDQSFNVAGKYLEEYQRVGGQWLFQTMELKLYFSVPLNTGWAGPKRHYLVNSGETVPDYPDLRPNPAV